jgi:hypothetical protein
VAWFKILYNYNVSSWKLNKMLSITDITVAYMPSILVCYLIIQTLEIANMATEDVKELGIRTFHNFLFSE